jgi:hypothetical protein
VTRLLLAVVWLLAAPAFAGAGAALLDDGRWRVIGQPAAAEPQPIAVTSSSGAALGDFAALEVQHDLGGGFVRILVLEASGVLAPSLPPPGEPGAVAVLGRYFECGGGLTEPLRFAALELPERAKGGVLELQGTLSNFDSLVSEKLKLEVQAPEAERVRVELSYRLRATRDFCVDPDRRETEEEFRIVELQSRFLSAAEHQNDLARYTKSTDVDCDTFGGCDFERVSLCAPLANVTGYVIDDPNRLRDRDIELFHTSTLPDATPTLAISMRAPSPNAVKPQGFVVQSDDPEARNVALWADWVKVRREHRTGKRVGRFAFDLVASAPRVPGCDRTQD